MICPQKKWPAIAFSRILSAGNYTAFLLRALGYDDSQRDFAAGQSLSFTASAGLMTADAGTALAASSMNRGDLVDLSCAALTCRMKGGGHRCEL